MKNQRVFLKPGVMAALETQQRAELLHTLANKPTVKKTDPALAQPKTPPPGTPTTEELMTPPPPAPEIERLKDAPANVAPLHGDEGILTEEASPPAEDASHEQPAGPTVRRRAIFGMHAAELRRAIIFSEIIAPPKGRR